MSKRYLALFILGLLATLPHWGRYHDLDDEATGVVLGAVRLLQGELPYRDWAIRHPPGSSFVAAIYFLVFGSGQWGTRSLMGLVSALTGLAIFRCSAKVVAGRLAYFPWLLWTCGGLVHKPVLNHHWLAALATAVTTWFCLEWALEKRGAVKVGVGCALTSWFLQSNGLTALLMVALLALRYRPPGVARLGLSYLATQALLWAPWLPWASALWANHVDCLQRHVLFNSHPFSLHYLSLHFEALRHLDLGQRTVHRLAGWGFLFRLTTHYGLFYLVTLGAPLLAEWRKDRAPAALAYCCLAWALTTGYCQDPSYLSFAGPAFEMALLVWLARANRVLVCLWAGLEVLAWAALAGSIALACRHPVQTRCGTYWSADPREAEALNLMHAFLEAHATAGSKVLAYPYFSRAYTLEKLTNPIPQPILLPWLFPEKDFANCLAVLKREQIGYILHRRLDCDVIHYAYPAVPMDEFRPEYARQEARILADYSLVWSNSGYEIWQLVQPGQVLQGREK